MAIAKIAMQNRGRSVDKDRFHLVVLVCLSMAANFLYVTPIPLCAQTVGGTILGVIRDEQGAVISGSEISARNLETGVIRNAISDDNGNYRILSVPAGSYEVTSSASGFKTEIRTGLVVTVGGDTSANFSLVVGAISEKVEVVAQAPQVDTSTSTLGGFAGSATIEELPLNGRDWLQLALLQSGASQSQGQQQTNSLRSLRGNGVGMDISGGRPTDNVFLIDGLTVNDFSNASPGSALGVNLGVDAIREFSVLTSSYSAEYGRGSGGVVDAITKSGTNQIHGSAYEYVRNSAFDARNFFDGQTVPPFHRDQYGGSVGGPIKKDKTFFFANYEKLGQLLSASSSVSTISANAHNGILCANAACTQTTQIAINPKVLPYLELFPVPNAAVSGNTGLFNFPASTRGEENYVIGKIDHYFSPMTTVSGSYSYDNSTLTQPDNFNLKSAVSPARRQNAVLSLQHVFSANIVDVIRVGVSRTYAGTAIDCCPTNPVLDNASLGFLPGLPLGPITVGGVTGVYGGIGSGIGTNGLKAFGYTAPQATEDLSWIKGRHNLRTGFSFERIDYNLNSSGRPLGQWSFSSIQNFLEGIPSEFQADYPGTNGIRGERMSVIAGYIQDDFRMRSNLTLNLGLRYEMGTVIKEAHGEIGNLRNLTDPTVTVGNPYYNNPTLKDFAPRIGFAWDPFKDGKTSIRGAGGIYDLIPLPYLFPNKIVKAPFTESGLVNSPPPSSFPNEALPLLNLSTLAAAHIQFNPPTSYMERWNLNIQRQLTKNLALTVGYVGSKGVHLAHPDDDTDQVPPSLVTFNNALDTFIFPVPAPGQPIQRINGNFGSIQDLEWDGFSSYNALQASLVQRPIKGLTYQIAYTFSKSIDNGSSSFAASNENSNDAEEGWSFAPEINKGVSDFNVPQNFVANFQYNLPVPAAVKMHGFANTILGGWQLGGIYTIQSGGPFTLKITGDPADTGSTSSEGSLGAPRPMYVDAPGCSPDAITGNINNYIMTQCFAFPKPGELGNLGRNTLHMPTFHDLDFSVFKNQNLWGEKLRLQFRAEMFNILNNVNFEPQVLTIFDGSGGLISSVGQPHGPTIGTSRQIQFGLKLLF